MRERRITELRRCGELRHAERYGWLALAGWLLGLKAAMVATSTLTQRRSCTGPAPAMCCPARWATTPRRRWSP